MPTYFIGILVGFLEPILHGWSNIVDNYFSNEAFPNLSVLLFFGTALNLVFLPFIIFFTPPVAFAPILLLPILFIGITNIAYQFPYYWALRHADTSIVASLFSLGKISVPILAFFVIGERLVPIQYLGFFLIIVSVILLTLDFRKLRFNRAFFLMSVVSLVLALQAISYKYVFEAGATWGSVIVTLTFLELFIAGAVMFSVNRLSAIIEDIKVIRKNLGLFGLQQGLEWGGNASSSFAVSVLPVTVAQAISSTQPFFVLAYAGLFGRRFSNFFKESTNVLEVIKKGVLFCLIIIGTVLVVAYGTNVDM